ncbi:ArnT family glycosyltransferase [Edaphobacter modestus]|uniref:4-amino-4-deoxy-L-arabinose transferase-like glycosyltransferase n=1 Tax=Edaphobacter modestus TaxID=388466 RepID=A0A4Q7YU89_9BACT|nr:glycosyltransferase family 39 protein [Edaphobacter modestus]RZU40583.1 4-amino-4-deoxy-L-arabinose transferase-like glycosyltransferase [Edaphobacter modestus]
MNASAQFVVAPSGVPAAIRPASAPIESKAPARRSWSPASIAIIVLVWCILQIGGLFTPGLLDDVDSIYTEIAREMLARHDYVIPYINGVRFFDKPPLMYWMAAASMRVFGPHDWAARLPLALGVLALFLAVYALGIRFFRTLSPDRSPDRGGFYAALALATSIGPYLYTRFYIPDILLALWMTLGVHLFLIARDRVHQNRSALLPCVTFAAVMALNVLTKGLIGLIFPLGFVLAFLALTGELRLLARLNPVIGTTIFLLIAAPWHVLAALRTPSIPLPSGLGLPSHGGWAWFYLYNEHIARFLGRRIPHDYGQVPIPLFWLLSALWIMPWTAFLVPAIIRHIRDLRSGAMVAARRHEAALSLLLWAALVLGFFTLSSRQEYYNLPALPALALMAAGLLTRADRGSSSENVSARSSALRWTLFFLVPLTTIISVVCGYFAVTAPHPAPGTDIASLLAANPQFYNLSLGHIFDLTGAAMGLFRGPLAAVALSMLTIGAGSYLLRRRGLLYAANLMLAAGMSVTLLAAHEGLARFYPILGSKDLALAINQAAPQPTDQIILDGELTSGSSLIFYTHQQLHLINGNVNGLWYGAFWPDSPHIFETEKTLRRLWSGPGRIFLFTYTPSARTRDLTPFGPVRVLDSAGGKTVLTNR